MHQLRLTIISAVLGLITVLSVSSAAESRPNILWFVVDDMSADFSCYGETLIETPEVDRLAAEGIRFTRAYATSPVCSTFRSALITGMYQNSIGVHHHRSGRGEHRIQLPEGVNALPEYFQEAGYWTCIGSGIPGINSRGEKVSVDRKGKTDYNFDWDEAIYDSHDWAGRQGDQPFFMQVQLHGGKIRGASENHYTKIEDRMDKDFGGRTDPSKVILPPYYPRDPLLLRDWSTYLDSVRITDWHVGQVMKRLQDEGLLDNTVVIFFTDHGISHARGKQFLYDEGTHIPLVITGPGIEKGGIREDLVEHIDVAALSLALADIDIPPTMNGKDILADGYEPKQAVFGARDRCGEAADQIRSVRSDRFLYIKNYFPKRPHLMPSNYKDAKRIIQRLRELHASQSLSPLSEKLLFAPERSPEEFYLYGEDRWQTVNLTDRPEYAKEVEKHRKWLSEWIERTGDPGPESPEVYILETQDQMKTNRNTASREAYRKNSELYLKWAAEGR